MVEGKGRVVSHLDTRFITWHHCDEGGGDSFDPSLSNSVWKIII